MPNLLVPGFSTVRRITTDHRSGKCFPFRMGRTNVYPFGLASVALIARDINGGKVSAHRTWLVANRREMEYSRHFCACSKDNERGS